MKFRRWNIGLGIQAFTYNHHDCTLVGIQLKDGRDCSVGVSDGRIVYYGPKRTYCLTNYRTRYYQIKRIVYQSVFRLRFWPVYWASWSRDCDCVEGTYAYKSKNGAEYLRDIALLYRFAEGPTRDWRITREEYENFKPVTRDRVLEAFERGESYYV